MTRNCFVFAAISLAAWGCAPPSGGAGGGTNGGTSGAVAPAASAPAPLDPGYALKKDAELEGLLVRAAGECRVAGSAGRPEGCDALDKSIDARIRALGPESLDTLVPFMVSGEATPSSLAVWYLGANFPRAIVARVAQDPSKVSEGQVLYLLAAARRLETQEQGAHRVARVAVSLATLKGMIEPVRTFWSEAKDPDVRAAVVGASMRYGRMQLFDVVERSAGSEEPRERVAAFQAVHSMPAWTDAEQEKLCPWMGGFLQEEEASQTQLIASSLLRCGGEWSKKVVEEGRRRVAAGTWGRSFGMALREVCQGSGAGVELGEERRARCAEVREVMRSVAESEQLGVEERGQAIDTFAMYWPDAASLEQLKGYAALENPVLKERAKRGAEAIEQRMKASKAP